MWLFGGPATGVGNRRVDSPFTPSWPTRARALRSSKALGSMRMFVPTAIVGHLLTPPLIAMADSTAEGSFSTSSHLYDTDARSSRSLDICVSEHPVLP